ncbi:hypothetical protein [Microbulbifer magnicolonia]|uniref:RNA polymerase sigma factor n=1 Tax=Microbulbifer magnicolonia TaxID=3109744 RepID=UPI002B400C0A|nr:hypothetical protein [Microbulbifer sp. GG15]
MSPNDFQHLSDEALLDFYHATRNINAFRQLYQRHKDVLYRYCSQMNFAGASGVLQALWNNLLEQPPELSGRQLRSWLFIQVNRLLRNCASQDPDAQQQLADPENRVLAGIQRLSRIERNILLLYTDCQLPLATVADIEKISLKKCREYYRTGKEKLEEFLYGPQRQPWRIAEVEEVSV